MRKSNSIKSIVKNALVNKSKIATIEALNLQREELSKAIDLGLISCLLLFSSTD
jgi:predicted kinase